MLIEHSLSLVIFIDCLKDINSEPMRILRVKIRFEVSEVDKVSVSHSDKSIDGHEEHSFDGFWICFDGCREFNDNFVIVGGDKNSKKIAKSHAGDQ